MPGNNTWCRGDSLQVLEVADAVQESESLAVGHSLAGGEAVIIAVCSRIADITSVGDVVVTAERIAGSGVVDVVRCDTSHCCAC